MRIVNLGSSSSGNCYYLELPRKDKEPLAIMIECGFTYKEILKRFSMQGLDITKVKACLVSHSHKDHCEAAKDLQKRGIKIYGNEIVTNNNLSTTMKHNKSSFIGAGVEVIAIDVKHDVDCFGFIINTSEISILFITDCRMFEANLSHYDFDYIFIETNYDGSMMKISQKNAKERNDMGEYYKYERLFKSHMSVKNAWEMLDKMNLSKTKAIYLIHLSDRHANEHKFKEYIQSRTNVNTYVCKKNGGFI